MLELFMLLQTVYKERNWFKVLFRKTFIIPASGKETNKANVYTI